MERDYETIGMDVTDAVHAAPIESPADMERALIRIFEALGVEGVQTLREAGFTTNDRGVSLYVGDCDFYLIVESESCGEGAPLSHEK